MDGTLYCGDEPTPFASEWIDCLRENGISFALMTNNPSRSPRQIAQKLNEMGIRVQQDEIITSAEVAVDYLVENGAASVYVLGGEYLSGLAQSRGLAITDDRPDYVLVGHTQSFGYWELAKTAQLLIEGSSFLCTDLDHAIPFEGKMIPHTGALAAYLQAVSGKTPRSTGKPDRCFLDAACRRLNRQPEELLFVGDNLETDIAMGVQYGAETALVLTGITDGKRLSASTIQPTYVFQNLGELIAYS
jgi:4-nitrophenyl phosphatase